MGIADGVAPVHILKKGDGERQNEDHKGVKGDVTGTDFFQEAATSFPGRMLRLIDFWLEHPNVRKVTVNLIVIQSIPHDKVIGNGKADIVNFHRFDAAGGLIQQGAQLDRGGMAGFQQVKKVGKGISAVQDILHHDDIPSGDVLGEVLVDLHLPRTAGTAAVGRNRQKIHCAGKGDAADEIGHEDKGAPQDADQHWVFAGVVAVDLRSDGGHPVLQVGLGKQYSVDVLVKQQNQSFLINVK
ncbi:hypothetical protein SDC9_158161 [bioreactor metagenome]|uniref:Uncharacterized protein n=1 Tax=bioreactor metagenome TaxID=1076179 RepID=A0A645FEE1_9ZZZZ